MYAGRVNEQPISSRCLCNRSIAASSPVEVFSAIRVPVSGVAGVRQLPLAVDTSQALLMPPFVQHRRDVFVQDGGLASGTGLERNQF